MTKILHNTRAEAFDEKAPLVMSGAFYVHRHIRKLAAYGSMSLAQRA
jgi:hypothetical protein